MVYSNRYFFCPIAVNVFGITSMLRQRYVQSASFELFDDSLILRQVVTGSWDSTVKTWDPRTSSCTGTYGQPDKVYAMSLAGEKLVVGTASRKVSLYFMEIFDTKLVIILSRLLASCCRINFSLPRKVLA